MHEGVARLGAAHFFVPERFAVPGVDRDEVGVDGAHVKRVAQDREAAVNAPAADAGFGRGNVGPGPEHAAGGGVERDDVIRCLDGIHDAVDNQRRGFELLERACLEDPLQFQIRDVGGRDLIQLGVAIAGHGAGVCQPVLRLFGGVKEPVEGDLSHQMPAHPNRGGQE